MYLENKVVFLAGSTGLVGASILINILNKHPTTKIRAVYHQHIKPFIEHERLEYVYGDLRLQEDCRRMAKGCDCAIMAAAMTSNSLIANSHPWDLVNDNVAMNLQMLEAFRVEGIKRVVFIGSATLYQESERSIKEDELDLNKDPHSTYFGIGWANRFIEKICSYWHRQYDGSIVLVRAANVFGPYSKFDPLTSNFIPALIRKAVDRMEPFEVWGNESVTRDVIYSEDFAEAVVRLVNKDSIKFDIFNVGYGSGTTVSDVVKWALKYAGHAPRDIVYNAEKSTTFPSRILDCHKVKKAIDWCPQYSVEEGIKKTVEWWIENKKWWRR